MRWLQLLASAEGNLDAQQRVLDTALAALRQIDDSRLHACVVAAVPSAQTLCELMDAFGVAVGDDLAQALGVGAEPRTESPQPRMRHSAHAVPSERLQAG